MKIFLGGKVVVFLFTISLRKLMWPVACDGTFTKINGSQVLFVKQKMNFYEAEKNCEAMNATLAEMWSVEDWREISKWLTDEERRVHIKHAVWIGLTDTEEEGTFLWLPSRRPLSSEIGNVSWHVGQPNGLTFGNQHCVCLFGRVPKMFDSGCHVRFHSVCQRREVETEEDYGVHMDDNTIVHIVVTVSALTLAICGLAFSVYCPRVGAEREVRSVQTWSNWKSLAIGRAEDTLPLHEVELENIIVNHSPPSMHQMSA